MKILIAPNAYKGYISSLEASRIIYSLLKKNLPGAELKIYPVSDGGDGFLECLHYHFNYRPDHILLDDITGRKRKIIYLTDNNGSAFIELAEISGIRLFDRIVPEAGKLALDSMGRLIGELYKRGYKRLYLGIGGSATNDCGAGILRGMGFRFYDSGGNEITGEKDIVQLLSRTSSVKNPGTFNDLEINVYCDVNNRLLGSYGSTRVYGPQKSISVKCMGLWEKAHRHYAQILAFNAGKRFYDRRYFGSAGGAGVSLFYIFKTVFHNGSDIFLNNAFKKHFSDSNIVITGEGRLDSTSFSCKAPGRIIRMAEKHDKCLIFLSGSSEHIQFDSHIHIYENKKAVRTRPEAIKELSNNLKKAIIDITGGI